MKADHVSAVELDVIVAGMTPMPLPYVFRPERTSKLTPLTAVLFYRDETLDSPCLAYTVRHPTAGTILIDTGFHPDAVTRRRQDFGLLMALMFRKLRIADKPYAQQLAELGIHADSVERVIMTHLHVDHTSGMRLLPSATFFGSSWERGSSGQPPPCGPSATHRSGVGGLPHPADRTKPMLHLFHCAN